MKNPSGLCMCGCGVVAPLAKTTRRGYKRGEPLMFIKGHSSRKDGPPWVVDENECWEWQKALTTYGYGHFGTNRKGDKKDHLAHRFVYEQLIGEIPDGTELHHLCKNRACVNPWHLQPLTRRGHMQLEERKAFGHYPVKSGFMEDARA